MPNYSRYVAFLFFAIYTFLGSSRAVAQIEPDSYSLTYQWHQGSVRDAYGYQIWINSSHTNRVVRISLHSVDVEVTRVVTIAEDKTRALYSLLAKSHIKDWKPTPICPAQDELCPTLLPPTPSGGSLCELAVSGGNQSLSVPCNDYKIRNEYVAEKKELTAFITSLVPQEIWNDFFSESKKRIAARPRILDVGFNGMEYRLARYMDEWRKKVEIVWSQNHSEFANYVSPGIPILSIAIRSNGSVDRIGIYQSSSSKLLDETAQKIVMMAAPFEKFPSWVEKQADVLMVTQVFEFTSDRKLMVCSELAGLNERVFKANVRSNLTMPDAIPMSAKASFLTISRRRGTSVVLRSSSGYPTFDEALRDAIRDTLRSPPPTLTGDFMLTLSPATTCMEKVYNVPQIAD
jgi:hypothetical protein